MFKFLFKLRKLKYRHKIALIIFLCSLIPMVIIGAFLIEKLWSTKFQEIIGENRTQLTNSVNGVDGLLKSNVDKFMYINNNFYLFNYLDTNSDQNLVNIMDFSEYLSSIMKAIKADNPRIELGIYAIRDTEYNGEYLKSIQGLDNIIGNNGKSLKDEILTIDEGDVLWKLINFSSSYTSDTNYICAYKKIMSLKEPIAITEIKIPFNQVHDFFTEAIPKNSFIACDLAGQKRIILKTGEMDSKLASSLTDENFNLKNDDYYNLKMDLKSGIGSISMYIPKSLIFKELQTYMISIAIIFLLIVAILFFTVEIVSFYLTKKLEDLFSRMNSNVEVFIKNNNRKIYLEDDEFKTLGNMFQNLTLKIKEYYQKINDYETEKKILETQLLQERINPHFLYNTLSTMKWISKDQRIQEVVDSMVKYYRIALNKGSSIVTISQELEMIQEYMKLQKFAYGNDFEHYIDAEDGVGNYLILKQLLQPIVENAVLHGMNGRETGGVIKIFVKRSEGDIIFEISDNGDGMGQEVIDNILSRTSTGLYGGYGMINIQKRMEVFYGKEYGINIKSVIGKGTTVIIKIPSLLDANFHLGIKIAN